MREERADDRFYEAIDREMTAAMLPDPDDDGYPYLPRDVKAEFDRRVADYKASKAGDIAEDFEP
jgi:hypothetical protein